MQELTREQQEKLKKYLINADPFLWGLLDSKNKKGRLQELKDMGYCTQFSPSANPNYINVYHTLLVEIGIEGIIERIVIPKVQNLFTKDVLDFFLRCWEQGQTPNIKYLRDNGLYRRRYRSREVYEDSFHYEPPSGYKDPPFIFVQIEAQQNFVQRWTVFAGLWFEEILPLLD